MVSPVYRSWQAILPVLSFAAPFGAITASGAPALAETVVLRVEGDAGSANPPGLGSGWGVDAYRHLNDALTYAQQLVTYPGTTVQVWVAARAPGHSYLPDHSAASPGGTGSPGARFILRSNVQLYGGFLGTNHPLAPETSLAQRDPEHNITVLGGNIGNPSLSTDNSQHIVYAYGVNETAVLSGFTITGARGSGITLLQSSPRVLRCVSTGNSGVSGAGAKIFGFTASGSNPLFVNCSFIDNDAAATGGGMYIGLNSGVTLVNCVFGRNSAAAMGGGLYAVPTLPLDLVNCTFSGNDAHSSGGGLAIAPQAMPVHMTNCIVWGNTATAASTTVEAAQISILSSPELFSAAYSCIEGLDAFNLPGSGNIGLAPVFAGAFGLDGVAGSANDNLRLTPCSPAINAGMAIAVPSDTTDVDDDLDFGGVTPDRDIRARIVDCRVDMGAYEHQARCTGDLNSDGLVNLLDLGIMVSNWSIPETGAGCDGAGPCDSDLDCNAVVNTVDLGTLLSHWGDCPDCL